LQSRTTKRSGTPLHMTNDEDVAGSESEGGFYRASRMTYSYRDACLKRHVSPMIVRDVA
jgi:hypothetical protein